ncbi:hypothetical protein BKA67DRAFT_656763 [Truncatella angustata]|uniref:Uncharacterized protein n=1 Tax=Truncatella angustata TaxID=152316 RepID=A0A9P9A2U7_9PEZI|nr:uncharacterized protein BKA67DRAFT_656763 [Truncatella angustata]KAH6658581.1 hypothetical protein BKA67DRAFT_656763 [Truncatella angustata]
MLSSVMHAQWMLGVIIPRIAEVPDIFRPLLRGLLRRQPHKRWSALKCLAWLGSNIQAVSDSQNFNSDAHASPSNESATDRETILLAGGTIASPVESSKRRKRPASASLSEANYGLGIRSGGRPAELRSLRFSEDSHDSPEQVLPAPSLVLRQSSRDLPSTPTPRARFVTPPIPQSPGFRGSPSEIPSTLAPEVPFVTPPPPSPRPGRVPHHGALVYSPTSKSYNGASFGGPLVSPSWAPTPDRDEGEFPTSGEDDEYSMETSDSELLNEWNDSDSEDEDEDDD